MLRDKLKENVARVTGPLQLFVSVWQKPLLTTGSFFSLSASACIKIVGHGKVTKLTSHSPLSRISIIVLGTPRSWTLDE